MYSICQQVMNAYQFYLMKSQTGLEQPSSKQPNKPNLLLAMTGSVATIKIDILALSLLQSFNLKIILTQHAKKFVKQSQFEQLKAEGLKIYFDEMEWEMWQDRGDLVLHIQLRKWADLMLIAPLSANTLAKITHGLSDNLVTLICRAWDMAKEDGCLVRPIFMCPAMNTFMWDHPLTSQQLDVLKGWGFQQIGPIEKMLMCGEKGNGAMAQISIICTILQNWKQQFIKNTK